MNKLNVLARVVVTLPDAGKEYVVDWSDASQAKDKAAKWLLALDVDTLPETASVHVDVQQRSDDTVFVDHGIFVGQNDKELGVEYAAKFLKNYPTPGAGKKPGAAPRFGGGGRR